MKDLIKDTRANFKDFLKGAFDFKSFASSKLHKEGLDEMDNFILLFYSDLLGLPSVSSYYALELLPYLASDLDTWERRMMNRKTVLAQRWGNFDWCC